MFETLSTRKEKLIRAAIKQGLLYYSTPKKKLISTKILDSGLVILSRFPIVETDFHAFKVGTYRDSIMDKGCLYCKIKIGENNCINIFNAHT